MSDVTTTTKNWVELFVRRASADSRKGNYRAYQEYIIRLRKLELDPCEYQHAVKRLAKALEV